MANTSQQEHSHLESFCLNFKHVCAIFLHFLQGKVNITDHTTQLHYAVTSNIITLFHIKALPMRTWKSHSEFP